MVPTEVHIQLVVYDAQAMAGLRIAAINLLKAAQRSVDPDAIEYFHRAYFCVVAAEAAYARLQGVTIEHQSEAVHALPDLCRDWCGLMEDMRWPERAEEAAFPGLSSLCAGHVVGDLVEDAVRRSSSTEERALQFLLDRNDRGEWVAGVDALAPPAFVESRLLSLWRRLQRITARFGHRAPVAQTGAIQTPTG